MEGGWRHIRSHMPKTGTRKWLYKSYLLEYIYRQQFHGQTFEENFGRFLCDIRTIYNPYLEGRFIDRLNIISDELLFLPSADVFICYKIE